MQQKQSFTYNSIPNQQLRYANELTIAKWNAYINELKTQANDATTYIETLHKWFIGTSDNVIAIPESKSFAEYVLSTLSIHKEKLKSHDATLTTHKIRLDSLDNEITKIKDGTTEVHTAKNYSISGGIANKFSSVDANININKTRIDGNQTAIAGLNTEIYNTTDGLKKRMKDAEDAIKVRSAIYVITYE